jgi:hypothetical protein
LLVEAPHLVEELRFGNISIPDPNCSAAATTTTRATRPPIDKDKKHKDQDHAPENEFEVTQVVS